MRLSKTIPVDVRQPERVSPNTFRFGNGSPKKVQRWKVFGPWNSQACSAEVRGRS